MENLNGELEHPYIIRKFGDLDLANHGLGYELFLSMNRYKYKIAQIVAETGETETYEEFLKRCIRCSIALKNRGFNDGKIIGICSNNNKDVAVPAISSLFLGCQTVFFNSLGSIKDTSYLLTLITPDIMFVEDLALDMIKSAMEMSEKYFELIVFGECEDDEQHFLSYQQEQEDEDYFQPVKIESIKKTAIILFSSGTTGLSKGICISHYALLTQGINLVISGIITQCTLTFASLYWISANAIFIGSVVSGTSRVIAKSISAEIIWESIHKFKVSLLTMSPNQCLILTNSEKPEGIDTSSLTCLFTGGSILNVKVMAELRDLLPGTFVFQAYGATELAGAITLFNVTKKDDQMFLYYKPQSCGRPLGGVWYKVVDVNTEEILPCNKTGELRLKSKLVMNGYYNKDSSECFDSDGWFKTGDLVYYDEHECFYIVGRIKELIKFQGWHVQPVLLENVLLSHPAIVQAVVFGVPNEVDGEHPMAVVVLKENHEITEEEIELFVENEVSDTQKLRGGVKIIDEIPLTSTGKVQRNLLKKMILDEENNLDFI